MYINANELIEKLEDLKMINPKSIIMQSYNAGLEEAIMQINKASGIEDLPTPLNNLYDNYNQRDSGNYHFTNVKITN